MDLEERKKLFLKIFLKAKKHYDKESRRLAGEGWKFPWQTLIATILSPQTTDEVTIPVSIALFRRYTSLKSLSDANFDDVKKIISRVNYNNTKTKHVIMTAKILVEKYNGKVPDTINELLELPGVGRKVANLILAEEFNKQAVCVDTHVHRISNVFGFVKTNTPDQTEQELMNVVPKKYWNKINRVFVLWGQDVKGYDKDKFLDKINYI
ncbi:endonuclease III [Candidatus Woesearchaeota archaeon]|nr:endonuclease III [Candidatus Woesearchaeota archaeon]MCF7901160.1 endonuclease III [Candidatus Woesearchaeota archaeon]MCF8013663.1 endonuclease III [Candidatus Woesearchaeota archaeon]